MPITITATLLLLNLSGCYWNVPVTDLLSPPMLTEQQTEIYAALTNSEGTALTLKFPKSGDFLSAFVVFPDDSGRVMVFYEKADASAEPAIWLTFLEKRGNAGGSKSAGWEVTYSMPFFATAIEQVAFPELSDTRRDDIVISTSFAGQPDCSVYVIAFDDDTGAPQVVYTMSYCMFYQIGDFNNTGKNMLMSISASGGEINEPSMAEFARWEGDEFIIAHRVRTNPAANEYLSAVKSALGDTPALFIEYLETNGNANTNIIVWETWDDRGIIPRNIVVTNNPERTKRNLDLLKKRPNQFTALAFSRDIEEGESDDSAFNPAGNVPFPGYGSTARPDVVRATVWYKVVLDEYVNDVFEPLHYTYLSVNNDYVFFFPDEWVDNATVTVLNDPCAHAVNEVVFWAYEPTFHTVRDVTTPWLTVITVPKGAGLCAEHHDDAKSFMLFDSQNNPQYDYYVKTENRSITRRALRSALKVFEVS